MFLGRQGGNVIGRRVSAGRARLPLMLEHRIRRQADLLEPIYALKCPIFRIEAALVRMPWSGPLTLSITQSRRRCRLHTKPEYRPLPSLHPGRLFIWPVPQIDRGSVDLCQGLRIGSVIAGHS